MSAAEWQPIETAPRDGTWVIGADMSGPNAVLPYPCAFDEDSLLWAAAVDFHLHHGALPTHWMPLPDPPSGEAKP